MHILFIPSWYPNHKYPLNGIYFKEQAEVLKEAGMDITVVYANFISFNPINFIKYKDNRLTIVKKIENNVVSYGFPKFQYKKAYLFYFYLKKIYKKILKEKGKPDIIHAHSTIWAGYYAVKLAKEYNLPIVITEHASMFRFKSVIDRYKNYLNYVFSNVEQFVVVGPDLYKIFSKYLAKEKLKLIPNMVNFNFFSNNNINKDIEDINNSESKIRKNKFNCLVKPIKYKKNKKRNLYVKNNNEFIFFSLGQLRKIKGFDILIKAFKNAFYSKESNYQNKDIKLLIGGDGKERRELNNLIKKLKLEKSVILLGSLNRYEVRYYMELCNAFVLASRYETFGIAYIEALSFGKPVIATKCGGPEIIVNDNNGYLVDIDNVEDLSIKLKLLKKNIKKFNSEFIKNDCKIRFGKEIFVNNYIKLYSSLLK